MNINHKICSQILIIHQIKAMKKAKKTSLEIKLIDGEFDVTESQEIILELIKNKISFHTLKNFSSEERTGKKDKQSVKRIKELSADRVKFDKFLGGGKSSHQRFIIKSFIHITEI